MGPKPAVPKSGELFRQPLIDMLNLKHPLVKLAEVIDWDKITQAFSRHFVSDKGRPALPPRLVAGLLYLQHAYDCSDEEIVNTWVENPYVQYFTGETYFQTDIPLDSSSLTRWRQRLGAAGVELLLQITIDAARQIEMIKNTSVNQVIVDTMPKAMAYPTDSRLLEQSRQHLVKLAEEHNLCLRQNYNRQAPKLVAQIGRYAHARQYNRMKKAVNTPELAGSIGKSAVNERLSRNKANLRLKICYTELIVFLPRKSKIRTSCMPCMRRKSSASAKARSKHLMSLVSKSASPRR